MKKSIKLSRYERIIIVISVFILFFIIGIFVRLSIGNVPLVPLSELFWALLPMALGIGIFAGILAYIFPKPFMFLLYIFTSISP